MYILQVCEGAKKAGAKRIIGVDTDPAKFDLGTQSKSVYSGDVLFAPAVYHCYHLHTRG